MSDQQPNLTAAEYIGLYASLASFAVRAEPGPFKQAATQAVQLMAPLAADVLLRDRMAQAQAAAAPPEEK